MFDDQHNQIGLMNLQVIVPELQRPIEYRKVPEQRNYDRTRPVACDRTLVYGRDGGLEGG